MEKTKLETADAEALRIRRDDELERLQAALNAANDRFHAMNSPTGREIELQAENQRLRELLNTLCPDVGFGEVFDDYCAALPIVTEFARKATLHGRVQALRDDRDRLQAENQWLQAIVGEVREMKVNKTLRDWSKQNGCHLVTFAFETERRGKIEMEGCVLTDDTPKLAKILQEINAMCDRAEKAKAAP